jgi:HEPN domain-containing protein
MSPEDARTHLTREWLTKASHDLRGATLASSAQAALWDIAAFHAQQAAEKALKAFLACPGPAPRASPAMTLVELLALNACGACCRP